AGSVLLPARCTARASTRLPGVTAGPVAADVTMAAGHSCCAGTNAMRSVGGAGDRERGDRVLPGGVRGLVPVEREAAVPLVTVTAQARVRDRAGRGQAGEVDGGGQGECAAGRGERDGLRG